VAARRISPALERALGNRLRQAGPLDLLAALPTLAELRAADPGQVRAAVAWRSPRLASKFAAASG
jgi:hypothetical protein